MWKYLNECVQGTSHRQTDTVCQDSSFVTPYRVDDEEVLILACSDGAGSAKESHVGSALACTSIIGFASTYLDLHRSLDTLSENVVQQWVESVHQELATEAERRGLTPRDLACTLLFSIVSAHRSVFVQIGDGAMVISQDGGYSPVFWPQTGEYQNTTYFITDEEFKDQLQIQLFDNGVDELAMFTDGLQMLALNYTKKNVHEPFFKPMFQALQTAADRQDLIIPMKQFLDSRNINDRTDDDKTLILATRVPRVDAIV